MRIAQIAPLTETVPPTGYGGTELVVSLLTEELVKRGHEVSLFASGDSKTKAELVSVVPTALRKTAQISTTRWPAYEIRSLLKLREMERQFDVIHCHMPWQSFPIIEQLKTPVVLTCHNLIAEYCTDIYRHYKDLHYVAISNAYKNSVMADTLNYIATVYNGIDLDKLPFKEDQERTYLLFVGRICADKGTATAIDMAKKIGLPLKIAGKVDVADRAYFETEVEPRLSEPGIEFLGEINHEEKVDLYGKAIATLYPIIYNEPFGLVMAESIACGTPVMALDCGSVREVLSDGETAIIEKDADALVKRFPEVKKLTARACRDRAQNLFSKERMTSDYEAVYTKIVEKSRTPASTRP